MLPVDIILASSKNKQSVLKRRFCFLECLKNTPKMPYFCITFHVVPAAVYFRFYLAYIKGKVL